MHGKGELRDALNQAKSCSGGIHAVFCHTEVAGARLADRVVSSAGIAPADFPSGVPVYSGHLHRPHMVGERIRYVGSPYQVSAAESGQQKSLCILDRLKGWEVVEEIPVHIGPRHWVVRPGDHDVAPFWEMRMGDRVTFQIRGGQDEKEKDLVAGLRKRGIRVEIQKLVRESVTDSTGGGDVDPMAPTEPRIAGGTLSNIGLFQEYARIKNLDNEVTTTGKEILQEAGEKASKSNISIFGKEVVIEWESVTLKSFGSFLDRVTYPLRRRGLVLVTGRYCDEDGTITGRTNGTGKTTLVMAALWALTGKTDARPDGSVEKGVSLEMVHDDAIGCEVTASLRLRGGRVWSEARDMMTPTEREMATLGNCFEINDALRVEVTRKSSRPTSSSKTRTYRQELFLKVNDVDLSCLDVKETQARIDRLVNGTLLPHTVFFGQHMGAGRGLLDSTDRDLKEHLALIFPLDIWKEARRRARDKASVLQEKLITADAMITSAMAAVTKLTEEESLSRLESESFESIRESKIAALDKEIQNVRCSFSRWEEDSICYNENLSIDEVELVRIIADCKSSLKLLDEDSEEHLADCRASGAAAVARAAASLESALDRSKRVGSLVKKSKEWERNKQESLADIDTFINSLQSELDAMQSQATLNERWTIATDELRNWEANLEELVHISFQGVSRANVSLFAEELKNVSETQLKASAFDEEQFRLQASLEDIQSRLEVSERLSLVSLDTFSDDRSELISGSVACETCLRPFDGELYTEARSKLLKEATSISEAIQKSKEERRGAHVAHEIAMRELNEKIIIERSKLQEKRAAASSVLRAVRHARDSRYAVIREIENFRLKRERLINEKNLYQNELTELFPAIDKVGGDLSARHETATRIADQEVSERRADLENFQNEHAMIMQKIELEEIGRAARAQRRDSLRLQIDDLNQLQSRCRVLENQKQALKMEVNPQQEKLRMLTENLRTERALLQMREKEFSKTTDAVSTLKSLDTAFGPRGVPSFILEEGLMWLEKLTGEYLQKLSGGELMLQIRAFSDYKSSNRADGENKEVISKRVFTSDGRQPSKLRERTLRQLSGGQRRRCSLAFALAFADLAHERAGFQSSMVVMDEILQSLDEDGRRRISKILPGMLREGYSSRDTVIIVAQDEAPEVAGLAHGGIDVVERNLDQSTVFLDGNVL
eukprot:GFKZ01013744.1.p1 GENE.GFKZ01013744.1~~GFKZ01013744.1.p1  ORF type:complete len:1183 (+),score=178.19 GFKZ01013744.1:549-4097(+)